MSDFEIRNVRFRQPLKCKCGRPLTDNDADQMIDGVEIVCSGCHETVLEIRIETFSEAEPWG